MDIEKVFDKAQQLTQMKISQTKNSRELPQPDEWHLQKKEKSIANIIFGEKLNSFSLNR